MKAKSGRRPGRRRSPQRLRPEGELREGEKLDGIPLRAAVERSRRQQEVIVAMGTSPELAQTDIRSVAAELTERAARAMGVERVGVWLLDTKEDELCCLDLYEASLNRHSSGAVLRREEYGAEFRALLSSPYVDAHDALSDPRTAGYVEGYLKPLRITSMLDAVIRIGGRPYGALCFEHVDRPHRWGPDEIAFACQLADLMAISILNRERRRAEEKRGEMDRRLLHAQKLESLGVLAGGIAHDFNNLLTAILGNLDLALDGIPPASPARRSIEAAVSATKRAETLTRQMLAYSGKGSFVVGELDVSALVEENVRLLTAALPKNAALNLRMGRGLPPVSADAGQIQQVVMNLITNAAESLGEKAGAVVVSTGAMECGEEYLRRSRTAEKPAPGRFVWLEVTDTGCGMDAGTQQRIFDPFFSTKFAGRGLGMSVVLGIVRGHRGAVVVESEVGRGSAVRVLFPASAAAPAGKGEGRGSSGAGRPARGKTPRRGTVLVADDEEAVRETCAAMAQHGGYRTLVAATGAGAVAVFRENADAIDCVILDLTMPGMNGVAALEEMRRIRPGVRVLLSSGYSEEEATRRFAGRELAGFIQKPYTMAALLAALERACAR